MPTVLDSPRFFDERPLSEWGVVGEANEANEADEDPEPVGRRAAARDEKRQEALWHLDEWPTPTHPADPISVEVVRGADGPLDDSWTLVIDGLRCDAKRKMTDHDKRLEKGLLLLKATARRLGGENPLAAAAEDFRDNLAALRVRNSCQKHSISRT